MQENEFIIEDAFVSSAIVLTTDEYPKVRFNPTTKKAIFVFQNSKAIALAFQTYMAGSPLKIYADLVKSLRVEALKLKSKHEGIGE